MKRKLMLLLLTLLTSVCLLFGLSACGGGSKIDGTYYQYEDGQIDKSLWIKLDDGKWSDDEKSSGTYKVDGNTITFYVELSDEQEELCEGTLKNGKLTIDMEDIELVYYKNGKIPSASSSSNKKQSSQKSSSKKLLPVRKSIPPRKTTVNRTRIVVIFRKAPRRIVAFT